MQEYSYEALMASGNVASGVMSAEDEEELEHTLRAMGHYLIRAEPIEGVRRTPQKTDGPVKRRELQAFTEYMWSSIEAGIPMLTSLEDVETRMDGRRFRQIIKEIYVAVREEGLSLSEAMAEHPQAFPTLFVGTVSAGEASGRLDYALGQLTAFLEWQEGVNANIRQATFYPIMLLFGMVGLIVLLLAYVYPKLMPIFIGFDISLPLPTRILMGLSNLLLQSWEYLLAGLAALVVGFKLVYMNRTGKYFVDRSKLFFPVFGELIRSIEMARFVTYMALFYRTGIDLLQGLSLLEQISANAAVSREVRRAREAISAGDSIADAFSYSGLFPRIVIRGMALGEATGKLDEALERAKAYYDREVPAAVARMLAALQPLLVLLLGGILLMVTLSIFLPILSIYNSLGS